MDVRLFVFLFFFLEENTFEWVFHEGNILSQYFNSHFQSFAPNFVHTNAHMLFVKGEVKDRKKCSYQLLWGLLTIRRQFRNLSPGNLQPPSDAPYYSRGTASIGKLCHLLQHARAPPTQPSLGLTLLKSLTSLIITAENMDPYTAGHRLT